MDYPHFLVVSLSLLGILPHLSVYSIRLRGSDKDKSTYGSVLRLNEGGSSVVSDPSRVAQLSWRPRAFLYKGFLSEQECDHLIFLARDKLEKSMVADNESGKSIESSVRTSSGMFLDKAQDEIVTRIEARIAAWTFLPAENGESLQILHYENGQKYEPHFDFFRDLTNQQLGGHRVATVLMYLSNVEMGGETIFPNSEAKSSQPKDNSWSECAHRGHAVKPEKGDALLFFNLHLDATTDDSSLHGSCPVIKGEKWSATKWIHVGDYDKPIKPVKRRDSGKCVDENKNCSDWARRGECQKNPLYMVGSEEAEGHCRKSCNACSGCISQLHADSHYTLHTTHILVYKTHSCSTAIQSPGNNIFSSFYFYYLFVNPASRL